MFESDAVSDRVFSVSVIIGPYYGTLHGYSYMSRQYLMFHRMENVLILKIQKKNPCRNIE